MKRYLIVLLLLAIALPVIVIAGSSSVTALTATATATPTPTTVPSFFICTFGVHIFPGADPMGTYTVNLPEGSVSGHQIASSYQEVSKNSITVYLSNTNNLWSDERGLQGGSMLVDRPVGSYITTLDINGNYAINNVVFGHYYVYWTYNLDGEYNGFENYAGYVDENYAGSVDLTAAAPHAIVNLPTLT